MFIWMILLIGTTITVSVIGFVIFTVQHDKRVNARLADRSWRTIAALHGSQSDWERWHTRHDKTSALKQKEAHQLPPGEWLKPAATSKPERPPPNDSGPVSEPDRQRRDDPDL
jgi:hypothetical protein